MSSSSSPGVTSSALANRRIVSSPASWSPRSPPDGCHRAGASQARIISRRRGGVQWGRLHKSLVVEKARAPRHRHPHPRGRQPGQPAARRDGKKGERRPTRRTTGRAPGSGTGRGAGAGRDVARGSNGTGDTGQLPRITLPTGAESRANTGGRLAVPNGPGGALSLGGRDAVRTGHGGPGGGLGFGGRGAGAHATKNY